MRTDDSSHTRTAGHTAHISATAWTLRFRDGMRPLLSAVVSTRRRRHAARAKQPAARGSRRRQSRLPSPPRSPKSD